MGAVSDAFGRSLAAPPIVRASSLHQTPGDADFTIFFSPDRAPKNGCGRRAFYTRQKHRLECLSNRNDDCIVLPDRYGTKAASSVKNAT